MSITPRLAGALLATCAIFAIAACSWPQTTADLPAVPQAQPPPVIAETP